MLPPPMLVTVDARLDRVLTRNAHILTCLRHIVGELHRTERGHSAVENWSLCAHARCQRVHQVIEELDRRPR